MKRQKTDRTNYCLDPLPTEIDNHVDTICFGTNFRPIYFTSQVCTVSLFLDSYIAKKDIPIYSAVTTADLEDETTALLEAGQGLYFGKEIDWSFLNPNQLRAFGVPVYDDPIDLHRELGINLLDVFVPMKVNSFIYSFVLYYPTDKELYSCKQFQITDEIS